MVLTEKGTLPIRGNRIPARNALTITFKEHNEKTEMTLRHMGVSAGVDSKRADQGWNQSFDKLAESPMEMST